jgi:CRISPR-associated protein Csm1
MQFNNSQKVALSALLHDVGKFRQRAGLKVNEKFQGLYCPYYDNRPTHIHAAHTGEFMSYLQDLNLLGDTQAEATARSDENWVGNVGAKHHRTDDNNIMQISVRLADWLSSGFDRQEYSNYLKREVSAKRNSELLSVFEDMRLSEAGEDKTSSVGDRKVFIPLQAINSDAFPVSALGSEQKIKEKYLELWQQFESDVKMLSDFDSFDQLLGGMQNLLENYTWCMPASAYREHYPNVSLYDHLLGTSAIATAIYRYAEENSIAADSLEQLLNDDKPVFRLIQGDFSGIQNFIFGHFGSSNKYGAKLLRSRSFFVSFCTRMAARIMCEQFGVYETSIVLSAAGKFNVLVPNLGDSDERIAEGLTQINDFFLKMNYGETRMSIGTVEFGSSSFRNGEPFKALMGKLNADFNRNRYSYQPQNFIMDETYLQRVDEAGDVCRICDRHPADGKPVDGVNICRWCESFSELGRKLAEDDEKGCFLVLYRESAAGDFELPGGFSFSISQNPKISQGKYKPCMVYDIGSELVPRKDNNYRVFPRLRIKSFVPKVSQDDLDTRYAIFMKNVENRFDKEEFKPGTTKSFALIAEDSKRLDEEGKDYVGKAFLGVLKADVDNLGSLFLANGRNISGTSYLSRMLDFFFTAVLQKKINEQFKSIYTVFAGGDDLFLIGPWTQINDFAVKLPGWLSEWAAGYEKVHISAGISLSKPGQPVYTMAHAAEEELEKSKAYREDAGTKAEYAKNAVTVFGQTVKWTEFAKLLEISQEMDELLEPVKLGTPRVSMQFMRRFFTFINMHEASAKDVRQLRWRSLYRYLLYRNYKEEDYGEVHRKLLKIPDNWIAKYGKSLRVSLSQCIYKRRG